MKIKQNARSFPPSIVVQLNYTLHKKQNLFKTLPESIQLQASSSLLIFLLPFGVRGVWVVDKFGAAEVPPTWTVPLSGNSSALLVCLRLKALRWITEQAS